MQRLLLVIFILLSSNFSNAAGKSCYLSSNNQSLVKSPFDSVVLNIMPQFRAGLKEDFIIPAQVNHRGQRCAPAHFTSGSGADCQICMTDPEMGKGRRLLPGGNLTLSHPRFPDELRRCGNNPLDEFTEDDIISKQELLAKLDIIEAQGDDFFKYDQQGHSFEYGMVYERRDTFHRLKQCLSQEDQSSYSCVVQMKSCEGYPCLQSYQFNRSDYNDGPLGLESYGFLTKELFQLACNDNNYKGMEIPIAFGLNFSAAIRCQGGESLYANSPVKDFALVYRHGDQSIELTKYLYCR